MRGPLGRNEQNHSCDSRNSRTTSIHREAPRFGRSGETSRLGFRDLRKKMGAIEEELIQVNGKSTEDFANYPVKLDGKFSALQNLADSADTAPTAAELAVFAELRPAARSATRQVARGPREGSSPPSTTPCRNTTCRSSPPSAPSKTN